MITRDDLDNFYRTSTVNTVHETTDTEWLVNGAQHRYNLWVDAFDKSITPCLTGEMGGMPGAWENWVSAWHINQTGNYDNYVDIGANSGYFTFLMASYGLNVVAVEANPRYVDLLNKTIDTEAWSEVSVVPLAVTNKGNEKIWLNLPDTLHGGASVMGTAVPSDHGIYVKTTTIDAITLPRALKGKTLIKMDIEGAEELAFKGAKNTNKKIVPTYVLEYTPRAYSDGFYDALLAYGEVTMINFDGGEIAIDKQIANSNDDWITLVVRGRS